MARLEIRSPNGFTLLEVVVALAIVGLGVVTLLEIFSLGLRLGVRSFERTQAYIHTQRVFDEILVRRSLPEGREEGSVGERLRWRLHVDPVREETALALSKGWELKEMTLVLSYRDGEREKQTEVRTRRLVRKKAP